MGAFPAPERNIDSEGPDAGLGALFSTEHDGMVRMATLLVRSPAIAEEVVQDAFIAVRRQWSSIDRPGAYLRTTVVRGCAAVLRRRSLEERHRPHLGVADAVELPTHLVELGDAMTRLTDRQRVVVVLRYFADLPDDEIAHIIDARPSTVRSLARRALATLRKELE